jgi:hypothetical protein
MGLFRAMMFAAFSILASECAWPQFVISTLPSPPQANQEFRAYITGPFPGGFAFQITPEVTVSGNAITVQLHGGCGVTCPLTTTVITRDFPLPALPAGQYTMTVLLYDLSFAQFGAGQLNFTIDSAPPKSYEGLWLKADESGWGLNIAHQGSILFVTWFTYDVDGSGMWLVMSSGTSTFANTFSGTLYRTRGTAFNVVPWPAVSYPADYTLVGTLTLSFTDANNGTMTYTVGGVTQSKPIKRFIFATGGTNCVLTDVPPAAPNYQDLWVESPQIAGQGWGVNISHQGDTLFATWFTYQAGGKGQWLVMSNGAKTPQGTYTGALQRTTGPAFSAVPFNPGLVTRSTVGSASFTFTDNNNGIFSYTLDGVSQSKPITRYVFSTPATICQ